LRSSEPIPPALDLFQQGVDFLAAAELIFRADPRHIIDAAVLDAVFAVRLLLRSTLGDSVPEDANLSIADLFGQLDVDAQAAILRHADLKDDDDPSGQTWVLSEVRTWVEWHEFLEAPKGNAERAAALIRLARGLELYLLDRSPGWAGRNPYREAGPLARSEPLD
jgi:hypothetical protein